MVVWGLTVSAMLGGNLITGEDASKSLRDKKTLSSLILFSGKFKPQTRFGWGNRAGSIGT